MGMFEIDKLIEVNVVQYCVFEHKSGKKILDMDSEDFEKKFNALKNQWEKAGLDFSIRVETHKIEYYQR